MAIRGSKTVLDLGDDNVADVTHPKAAGKHASTTSVNNLMVVSLVVPVHGSERRVVFQGMS